MIQPWDYVANLFKYISEKHIKFFFLNETVDIVSNILQYAYLSDFIVEMKSASVPVTGIWADPFKPLLFTWILGF